MKYIIAYDGGGTKTRINLVDLEGNILFDKIATGSNYVSAGEDKFQTVIESLYIEALKECNLNPSDIELIYLGLSGADLEEDYERLYKACAPIFKDVKHVIVNDAWIILRSGLDKPYGAVAIAGTGTNSAAINLNGEKAILRALSFMLGTFGGGLDIARSGLHYAFRSEELTFQETLLETEIPKLFEKETMDDVVKLFYPKRLVDKKTLGEVTRIVNECALKGDEVSQMILEDNAYHIACQTIGVMKQVGIDQDDISVVVGGRVFKSDAPNFLESFKKTLLDKCPNCHIIEPTFTPVVGAYLFALDELNIKQTIEIENNLYKSGGKL